MKRGSLKDRIRRNKPEGGPVGVRVGEGSLARDGDGGEDAYGVQLALSSSPCQGQG